MLPTSGALERLQSASGTTWTSIGGARRAAVETREQLGQLVQEARLVPEDTAFVVFGSLARDEQTAGSDLDWALLVDGAADEQHTAAVRRLRAALREHNHKDPGPGGLFGGLAISHELVHRIGGEADSNRNITQRTLLLLESRSPDTRDIVRTRVLRVLLKRYLVDDFGYAMPAKAAGRVPRFLLNDIVRYWRTMAVDFAAKRRDRDDKGWGLRNFKLRMSRKLIFAAGLVLCLGCRLRPPKALDLDAARTDEDYASLMAEHVLSFLDSPPLEILAWACEAFRASATCVNDLFGSYDEFLAILNSAEDREALDKVRPEQSQSDPLFGRAREIGDRFQDGLSGLFFGSDSELRDVTQRFGVF